MEKRYQVFISSTYTDLQDERRSVMQALMEMDCIPAGMELFPACDEEQFEFIKKVIDDCDYYLVIVGGRYGSINEEGISYTEKEYDCAHNKGIKIIALLHGEPGKIEQAKTDNTDIARGKLQTFRSKLEQGRIVKYWDTCEQLPGLVMSSMLKTIKTFPAIGWIRGDQAAAPSILQQLNELRTENEKLKEKIEMFNRESGTQAISDYSGTIELEGTSIPLDGPWKIWRRRFEWSDLFSMVGLRLVEVAGFSSEYVSQVLSEAIRQCTFIDVESIHLKDVDVEKIIIHFMAFGWVQRAQSKGFCVTETGIGYLMQHTVALNKQIVKPDVPLPHLP